MFKALTLPALLVTALIAPPVTAQETMTQVQCNRIATFCIYHWYSAGYSSQDACIQTEWDPQCPQTDGTNPRGEPQYGNPYADITYGCGSSHVTC
jgi:hypothetical protein